MARLNESRIGAFLTEPFGGAFSQRTATTLHAEHATALLVGLDADVSITGAITQRARAVLVPADTPYAATCPGPVVSYAFDPELNPHLALTRPARIADIVHAHRATLANADTLAGIAREVSAEMSTASRAAVRSNSGASWKSIDRRIARLAETLRDPDADRVAAIAATRLSPAHVQDLFVRDIGSPIRTYSLWRRLLHALAHVGPLDLTAAAHAAGFADLAHFSRTCRRMLGTSPSELRANLVDG